MAKKSITWEWGDKQDQIIIRKAKGKLTMDDIWKFLNDREQTMVFGEGALAVIGFRIDSTRDSGWFYEDKAEGDEQEVFILADDSHCFCGELIYPQYCPDCGRKLYGKGDH